MLLGDNLFIGLIKRIRQNLQYQFIQFYFFIVPRIRPKFGSEEIGVNFIGYAHGELGLGQAMRSLVLSTRTASVPFVVRKFKASIPSKQSNDELAAFFSDHCAYSTNIICVNPDTLHHLRKWVSYSEWAKTYNIGYWFWELENFPKKWQYAAHIVDEIWVATDYIASAMLKSGKKVIKIPFSIEFELPIKSLNKSYFGLVGSEFTFLFSFDFLSSIDRKNPEGVIRAFRKAFPIGDDSVRLIIKTMNAGTHANDLKRVEIAIGEDPRIEIRDSHLTQAEMRGLILSADCYISLHRAEGLGLGLAESMYMGKPTIATGYSGNLEFMNKSNSMLISYELVPILHGEYPNGVGGSWAEPNISEAALAMRKIKSESDFREKLGARAYFYMRERHSYAKAALAIKARLGQIMM